MRRRSCLNTVNRSSGYDRFAYYDTDKYLADYLFAREKVDVTVEKEIVNKTDPYRIIRCRVPRDQREAFQRALDAMPDWLAYVGRKDYDAYCLSVLLDAVQHTAGKIPA